MPRGAEEKREHGGEGVEPDPGKGYEQRSRAGERAEPPTPRSRLAWFLETAGGEAGAENSLPATARLSPANGEVQGLVAWGGDGRPSPRADGGPV